MLVVVWLSWDMILDNYLGLKFEKRLCLLGNPN